MSISIVSQEDSQTQAFSAYKTYSVPKIEALLTIHEFNERQDYCPSRAQIAPNSSLKTGSWWTDDFHEHGFIIKTRNEKNKYKTCRYEVTPLFRALKGHIVAHLKYLKLAAITVSISVSVAQPVVTPIKSLTEKETNNYTLPLTISLKTVLSNSLSLTQESQTARVCAREKQPPEKDFRVDIPTMSSGIPEWLNPQIKKATELLNLTKWGQIKLTAYPPSAIEYAINAMRGSKKKKDNIFSWFASVCYTWCKERNVSPDWSAMNKLAQQHNMPEDANFTVEGAVAFEGVTPEEKQKRESELSSKRDKLQAEYREQKREEQRAWEATKTQEELRRNLNLVLPDMEAIAPIKDPMDHKKEIIRILEAKQNLTTTERMILEGYKKQMGYPTWSPEDQELVDWSLDFLNFTLQQSYANDWYRKLKVSIEQGPESPQAKSRELQEGLKLMRELIKESEAKKHAMETRRVNDGHTQAEAACDGIHNRNGTDTVEESRVQLQQESIL